MARIDLEAITRPHPFLAPRGIRPLPFVLMLTGLLRAGALAAQGTAPPDENPLVTGVVFRGVRHVDLQALQLGLVTKPTTCRSPLYLPLCRVSRSPVFTSRRYLDPLEFRRDVLRIRLYYWQRGWRDVTVDARTERSGPGVRAIFAVDEKAPTIIEDLRVIQADSVLSPSEVSAALLVTRGDPLDLVALDTTLVTLRDALWDRGHADATVVLDTTQVSDERNGGPVTITITAGPVVRVAAIDVSGSRRVSAGTVRRLLTFRPGDLYRRESILESQRSLYLSGMFAELAIEGRPGTDTARTVDVRVVEADLNRLEGAGGVTTADFLQLQAEYTRYNLGGSGRRLTLHGTVSNLLAPSLNGQGLFYDVTAGADEGGRDRFLQPAWAASIDVVQPWLFSPRQQLGLSVFTHRRAVPGIVIDRGYGGSAALTRRFGPRTSSTLGYLYEVSRVDASDAYFCVSFGVCLAPGIAALSAPNVMAPLASVTLVDATDDPFTPTHGYRGKLDVEHASAVTASDFRYNRGELTATAYTKLSRRTVLAGRLRVGFVQPLPGTASAVGASDGLDERIVHPRKRFYAGGASSVRGFGERQLGPRILTVSPSALTDTTLPAPCTEAQLRDLSCDPNIDGVVSTAFQPQPLGGTRLAEASVEWRFPISVAHGVMGALFVDGAVVSTNQFAGTLRATSAVTPGFGVRLDTPVGPVRLDLGVRPTLVEQLPVVTEVANPDGTTSLVTLGHTRRYDPVDTAGGVLAKVLGRLRLHLAIGPPY